MSVTAAFNTADVTARIKTIIDNVMLIHASDVQASHHLVNDLGADSLDMFELVLAVENEFGIDISETEAENCNTVQNIIDLVTKKQV